MKQLNLFSALLSISLLLFSCNDSKKEGNQSVAAKKLALDNLIKKKNQTEIEINLLQEELKALSGGSSASNAKLVAVSPVAVQKFDHYIDLRGRIDAENISFISSRGMGGQVKSIYIKEGDFVKKGQLLLKIDDAIMKQSLVAARQQLEGIKTQLSFTKNIYERQKNLWDKAKH